MPSFGLAERWIGPPTEESRDKGNEEHTATEGATPLPRFADRGASFLEPPSLPRSQGSKLILAYCDLDLSMELISDAVLRWSLAVDDAEALGNPLLETQARIWRASALRAFGEFADAREELNKTVETSRATMWLAALHQRMVGILEINTNHWQKALDSLRLPTGIYQTRLWTRT